MSEAETSIPWGSRAGSRAKRHIQGRPTHHSDWQAEA